MAYIQRIIANDERLIGVARLHWIYLITGLTWVIGSLLVGLLFDNILAGLFGTLFEPLGNAFLRMADIPLVLFFLCAGLFMFGVYFLAFMFTEVGLTTQRIIYKVGMIFVKVEEVNLEEIRGDHVNLGWFGRFLGYGSIALDARFVGDVKLPFISKPYRFVKAMNEAQTKLEDDVGDIIEDNIVKRAQKHAVRRLSEDTDKVTDAQAATQSQDTQQEKPKSEPHRVSEDSYEEKHLKEDLIEDFEESEEERPEDVSEEDYRPPQQVK